LLKSIITGTVLSSNFRKESLIGK